MLIQDWMSTNIVSIAPSASLLKCVALLKEKGFHGTAKSYWEYKTGK